MTKPHETDNKQKVYTLEQRIQQHNMILNLYKRNGYKVVEVPLKSENPYENNLYRLNFIKETLDKKSVC